MLVLWMELKTVYLAFKNDIYFCITLYNFSLLSLLSKFSVFNLNVQLDIIFYNDDETTPITSRHVANKWNTAVLNVEGKPRI